MQYQLEATRAAVKEIERLPPEIQQRIHAAILALATVPRPPGCRKLQGHGDYRIAVGDYRVIYEIDDDERVVTVWRVRHRRDVYRGL